MSKDFFFFFNKTSIHRKTISLLLTVKKVFSANEYYMHGTLLGILRRMNEQCILMSKQGKLTKHNCDNYDYH